MSPKKTKSANGANSQTVELIEEQFQLIQKKFLKLRESYLTRLQNEVDIAREEVQVLQNKLAKTRTKVAKAAVTVKNTGSASTQKQLGKLQTARQELAGLLDNAKEQLVTAQSNLHSAKPLHRKLVARAKLLSKFEKDWQKKMEAEASARSSKAKEAVVRRRATAKKRATRKSTQ